jgi:hypothetical protein
MARALWNGVTLAAAARTSGHMAFWKGVQVEP